MAMDFGVHQQNPGRRWSGLGAVVLLHVLIVYALVNGLARKAVEVVRGPMETKIIEELKKLPPPDKPPPPPKSQPKVEPPPFVPPSEVSVAPAAPVANTITVTQKESPPAPVRAAVKLPPVIDAARSCRKPEYPAASRRMQEEGVVVLSFLVDANGRVADSKVESSSGFSRLDEAARQAMSLCQFKPGTVDGKPEPAWARLKYEWRLETE
ncbi:MAG TPA: energy transducer TonB [Rhodocyclaceae bacterium]|nr:energy transducer TonB [Rhodocyclaceae bacterium]